MYFDSICAAALLALFLAAWWPLRSQITDARLSRLDSRRHRLFMACVEAGVGSGDPTRRCAETLIRSLVLETRRYHRGGWLIALFRPLPLRHETVEAFHRLKATRESSDTALAAIALRSVEDAPRPVRRSLEDSA